MLSKLTKYIQETRVEFKGVTWPSKKQTLNYTLLVIAASVGAAIFLGAADLLFTFLMEKFIL